MTHPASRGAAPRRRSAGLPRPGGAWCLAAPRLHKRRAPRGFTLLELLVVLVLAGLALALALPNLDRLYGAAARATERSRILDQIAALGREAFASGRAYALANPAPTAGTRAAQQPPAPLPPGFAPYPLELPEGWQVRVDEPILARATGVCLGGAVTLAHEDSRPERIILAPPFCAVAPARTSP